MKYKPKTTVKIDREYNPEWVDLIISILKYFNDSKEEMPVEARKIIGDNVRKILRNENIINKDNVIVISWSEEDNTMYTDIYDVLISEIGYDYRDKTYEENGVIIIDVDKEVEVHG